jgi:hypothetical protein
MPDDTLIYTPEVERGRWVREGLGDWSTIACVVPRGFDAYARVLHPVEAQLLRWEGDTPVTEKSLELRWRDVAERCRTVWHPLMQWSGIVGRHKNPGFGEPGWQYGDPAQGRLPLSQLAAIADILARHTGTPGACTAGLWEGYGWVHGGHAVSAFIAIPDVTSRWKRNRMLRKARTLSPPGLPREVVEWPRLELADRAYLLFAGNILALADPGWAERSWGEAGRFWGQTPNQLWPDDRAWFLASEIDFDSTIIAGTRELVDEIVACDQIEAVEIPADGSLASGGDTINETGQPPDDYPMGDES